MGMETGHQERRNIMASNEETIRKFAEAFDEEKEGDD